MELCLHSPDATVFRCFSTSFTSKVISMASVSSTPYFISSSHSRSLKRTSTQSSDALQRDPKKGLSRILRRDAAIKAIERKANSKKYNNLWPKAVLEALDEAIQENLWETALKIFGLLRQQQWYEPRCQTYTKLLMLLGKCKQPEQASLLFEIMFSEGLKPSIDVYTALVSAYGQSGLLHKAISTVDEMKSISDCKPDVHTYSILIDCCTRLRRFDLLKKILADMSCLGITCNTVTYNTIINGFGKAKMFEQMESLLLEMIESDSCPPDLITFNTFIRAYGNSEQIEKMEKWYKEFQLMGIEPDIWTYNSMISSYGKAGMYDKMKSVLNFMEKRFFSPTIVTMNTIIDSFGRAGNIEEMEEYFKNMKFQGMKPNSVTYCSLVNAYGKSGDLEKVDSILRQIENSDVVPDTPLFNCLINVYGQAGNVRKMGELFLEMKENKCVPDGITFATMIRALKAQGMTEDAQRLENKLIATNDGE
ncbi:pentatricopeptide repeat-containing protein At3g53170 isoform X1 [Cucumis sativus]|uniref:Pentacotripeptide-repeat region of PRORP domain-containing protein n=1 Tax=Cucumis sativus TaxID=3659 RepID=A0A0A0K9Q1_CUCSA|nr:pentatricopeptide repeat-containing protein At3g53170 isoform X1 [Cucumis sativus]XP_031745180.1 pentatricopeptide repeat-containing protein At3g53170 isoform X1 [Cucumis sativus]XP_031745181.1 pentatricopeptide repeat-containing protein At3g53170 isoform X1 [Cucumis sativus]